MRSHAEFADIVVTGAQIYTGDAKQPWATSLAVRGNRLVCVSDDSEGMKLIGPDTRHFMLNSDLILPTFVDSHTHPVTSTTTGPILELPTTRDPTVIVKAVAQYAKDNPNLSMIKGRTWAVDAFDDTGPTRELLDAVVPDRPVLLLDSSGHSQWVNSKALEIMGVTSETPDPVPFVSIFVRDGDGNPTGWLKEAALAGYQDKLNIPTKFDGENLLKFLKYLRALGVTTVYDAGIELLDVNIKNDEAYGAIAEMDKKGVLPVRYFGSYVVQNRAQLPMAIAEFKRLQQAYSGNRLRFNSVKLFLDGVSENCTSYMLEPFTNRPDSCGLPTISVSDLDKLLSDLHDNAIDFHVHTIGDAAVRMVLDAVEALQNRVGRLKMKVTMAHVELIHDDDMHRFQQLGVYVNHTPHWHGGYFIGQERTLGKHRASRTNRMATLQKTGAMVALSSDITEVPEWEQSRANPFWGIQIGKTRQEPGLGKDAPIFEPASERSELVDLITGYTRNGAVQLQIDQDLGSLEVGKIADFQILDADLFAIDPYQIHQTKPRAVFMDGVLVCGTLP